MLKEESILIIEKYVFELSLSTASPVIILQLNLFEIEENDRQHRNPKSPGQHQLLSLRRHQRPSYRTWQEANRSLQFLPQECGRKRLQQQGVPSSARQHKRLMAGHKSHQNRINASLPPPTAAQLVRHHQAARPPQHPQVHRRTVHPQPLLPRHLILRRRKPRALRQETSESELG